MWVNLCIHDIVIVKNETFKSVIAPSGTVARCITETIPVGEVDGLPITETSVTGIVGLPEPKEGTHYIVSEYVAAHCTDRDDVYFPNETIRNEQKKVIGSNSLSPSKACLK